MILLTSTSHILELLTGAAGSVDYEVDYVDITTSTFTPGHLEGNITTATTTTIVSAPASSTQRQIQSITLINKSSSAEQTVTVKFDVSGTERYLTPTITLSPGQSYIYMSDRGWERFSNTLTTREGHVGSEDVLFGNYNVYDNRLSISREAALSNTQMSFQLHNATTATPFGTFVNGTHGLSGSAITGGTARTGTYQVPNATTGHKLVGFDFGDIAGSTNQSGVRMLLDMLWINSGITVTTTTAQNFTPAAAASRDLNSSANGYGVMAGMWITSATTNAGTIANTTISYTNQDGTAGRTGTLLLANSTISANTVYFFSLQAGDSGVRTIESATLGTSYVTGALSFFLARPIYVHTLYIPVTTSGVRSQEPLSFTPGIFVPNNAALVLVGGSTSTGGSQSTSARLTFEDY